MIEEKNTSAEGQPSKKSAASQKSTAKKPQKERSKPDVQTKPGVDTGSASSLAKKIEEIIEQIENKPLKSFEKKEKEKLIQYYEKLIGKMVREINNSRR